MAHSHRSRGLGWPSLLLLGQLFSPALGQQLLAERADACTLDLNTRLCSPANWAQEYQCLARQYSLGFLLSCVPPTPKTSEERLCQDAGKKDGIADRRSADYWEPFAKGTARSVCVSAKQVMLAASDFPDCTECALRGLLKACPRDDPNFFNCLCEWNMDEASMYCLSRCFKPDDVTLAKKRCKGWPRRTANAARQIGDGSVPELALTPPVRMKRRSLGSDGRYYYYWDGWTDISVDGYVCVVDNLGDQYCSLGVAPQPHRVYRDTQGTKTCYIHPRMAATTCIRDAAVAARTVEAKTLPARAATSTATTKEAWELAVFSDTVDEPPESTSRRPQRLAKTASLRTTAAGATLSLVQPTPPPGVTAPPPSDPTPTSESSAGGLERPCAALVFALAAMMFLM